MAGKSDCDVMREQEVTEAGSKEKGRLLGVPFFPARECTAD